MLPAQVEAARNLAGGDEACQRGALEAGAAAAVVAALTAHPDAPSVQQGSNSTRTPNPYM